MRPTSWHELDRWIDDEAARVRRLGVPVPVSVWTWSDDWCDGAVRVAPWTGTPASLCLAVGDVLQGTSPGRLLLVLPFSPGGWHAMRAHRWSRGDGWQHQLVPTDDERLPLRVDLPDWDPWVRALGALPTPSAPDPDVVVAVERFPFVASADVVGGFAVAS